MRFDFITGDKCGATFVDKSFVQWLKDKLGPTKFKILVPITPEHDVGSHTIVHEDLEKVLAEFEIVKESFDGHVPDEHNQITLPFGLRQLEIQEQGIMDGKVLITESVYFCPYVIIIHDRS